jgi:hypothetical protein
MRFEMLARRRIRAALRRPRFCAADTAAGIMGARFNLALNGKLFEPCF